MNNIIKGQLVSGGAGVTLSRIIATPEVNNIYPFFLLDEFRSENPEEEIEQAFDDYKKGKLF